MPYLSLGLCCTCFGRKSSHPNSADPFTVTSNALNWLCQEEVRVTADITFAPRPAPNPMPKTWSDAPSLKRIPMPTRPAPNPMSKGCSDENTLGMETKPKIMDDTEFKTEALQLTTRILELLTESKSTYSDDPQSIRKQIDSNPLLKAHGLVGILRKNPNVHSILVKKELIRCLTDFNQYLTESKLDLFDIDNYSLSKPIIHIRSDLNDAINLLDKRLTPSDQTLLIKKMNGLKGISLDAIRNKLSNLETQQKYRQILRNFLITTNMLGEARALEMHKEYLLEFNL